MACEVRKCDALRVHALWKMTRIFYLFPWISSRFCPFVTISNLWENDCTSYKVGDEPGMHNHGASATMRFCEEIISSAQRLCERGKGAVCFQDAARVLSDRMVSER